MKSPALRAGKPPTRKSLPPSACADCGTRPCTACPPARHGRPTKSEPSTPPKARHASASARARLIPIPAAPASSDQPAKASELTDDRTGTVSLRGVRSLRVWIKRRAGVPVAQSGVYPGLRWARRWWWQRSVGAMHAQAGEQVLREQSASDLNDAPRTRSRSQCVQPLPVVAFVMNHRVSLVRRSVIYDRRA